MDFKLWSISISFFLWLSKFSQWNIYSSDKNNIWPPSLPMCTYYSVNKVALIYNKIAFKTFCFNHLAQIEIVLKYEQESVWIQVERLNRASAITSDLIASSKFLLSVCVFLLHILNATKSNVVQTSVWKVIFCFCFNCTITWWLSRMECSMQILINNWVQLTYTYHSFHKCFGI